MYIKSPVYYFVFHFVLFYWVHTQLAFAVVYPPQCIAESFIEKTKYSTPKTSYNNYYSTLYKKDAGRTIKSYLQNLISVTVIISMFQLLSF